MPSTRRRRRRGKTLAELWAANHQALMTPNPDPYIKPKPHRRLKVVTSSSRLAYQDIYELLDQVIGTAGKRVLFDSEGQCKHFRTRMHTARKIDREHNAMIYKLGDPLFGLSEYDKVSCKIRHVGGRWYCYFEEISLRGLQIEDLEDVVEEPDEPEATEDGHYISPAWEEVSPQHGSGKAEVGEWLDTNREQIAKALAETQVPTLRRRF